MADPNRPGGDTGSTGGYQTGGTSYPPAGSPPPTSSPPAWSPPPSGGLPSAPPSAYEQQPASYWARAQEVPGGRVDRPVSVAVAALLLTLLGLLFGLIAAVILLIGGAAADSIPPGGFGGISEQTFRSVFTGVGVVVLVIAVLHLLSGLFSFAGRNWARLLGIVISVLFFLLMLASLPAVLSPAPAAVDPDVRNAQGSSLAITVAMLVVYGFSAFALIRAGRYFNSRG
jgi:hypothetical protein